VSAISRGESKVMAQTDANALHVRMACLQVIKKMVNGRLVGTRTPDLYRVKAALLCTANNFKAVRSGLNTCKYA
jgi:hypothetical protein